jgi:tRNA 2-selenouridine synthase
LAKDAVPHAELFLNEIPFIDVRAPVEFAEGHLPGAVNLPLLNDEERAAVGTVYKNKGQQAAIDLGHSLVSGAAKEGRIAAWRDFARAHPSAIFYCFRGGLRSQISREWLAQSGHDLPLITGGYKAARTFLLLKLHERAAGLDYVVIAGATGGGKTELIRALGDKAIDLEGLANHRGSAFGGNETPQPSQANFENTLAVELMRRTGPVPIEDESRMIGRVSLPASLFDKMREAPVVLVEEPLEARIENIRREYVERPAKRGSPYPGIRAAVHAISRKLGGARAKEVLELLESADDAAWIEKLLKYYYDPLYEAGLKRRAPEILFRGTGKDCLEFMRRSPVS